jgi:2,3-bisphosphoglycerate-dependent phosphoglycerate mutase
VVTPLWPAELLLVRHAESAGNVASAAAEAAELPLVDIADRDMDVELSARGEEQACALGEWLRTRYSAPPDAVISSPYRRAERTAEIALGRAGFDLSVELDERLRERDFGMLDRLTGHGIAQRMPEQAAARARLGKFYYRPPGGESWTDVALRVRSVLDSLSREYPQRQVIVVAHEVVILVFRYVLQNMRERELLELARAKPLVNCCVTCFTVDASTTDRMVLRTWNSAEALVTLDAPVTNEPDRAVAPR